MSEWQPIETAPKDGTAVWAIEDGAPHGLTMPHYVVVFWAPSARYSARGFWQCADRALVAQPTHWMPLPDPPKDAQR